jgi:hypothetical protein
MWRSSARISSLSLAEEKWQHFALKVEREFFMNSMSF